MPGNVDLTVWPYKRIGADHLTWASSEIVDGFGAAERFTTIGGAREEQCVVGR